MTERPVFKIGDTLRISCPMTPAKVAEAARYHLAIEWPWRQIDPESRYRWNGQVALPATSDPDEWSPFTTEPPLGQLRSGDECLVGIPPTLVRVMGIVECEPPADIGWRPRPRLMVEILPVEVADSGEDVEPDTLCLDSAEPITIEVIGCVLGSGVRVST